ncbi:hypothetical protein CAOG_05869 [Capsaspora owczarzaki ATCC 30864]|uniref:L-seryl-tRNA(Sec) kinase n=1 Tax=Capsaspora owczarzaki (strain ATCC 30864) TaxID=595528 RepID=A0A0D2WSW4_CAPO3|nr:hypothetical protein CAOG_05869 [Capsaspora owczarzaki ATCC 30864]KJE95415.1 hypothetical protein CAOG_005869 [Capsaspora owczarzaki ATCC 30864]|eukprot:XP_004345459.2 hypothetical protein CAOG_05869 [Capsaspora owczarzaki ATCC 30864]
MNSATRTPPAIALVVCCGLPGSGKSTVTSRLRRDWPATQTEANPLLWWLVNVDQAVERRWPGSEPGSPRHATESYAEGHASNALGASTGTDPADEPETAATWRQKRARLIQDVGAFVAQLSSSSDKDYPFALDSLQTKGQEDGVESRLQSFAWLFSPDDQTGNLARMQSQTGCTHVVVVDDNNYYTSMRYSYYRIARQYRCAFGIVLFECETSTCVARNDLRHGGRIASEIIHDMSNRFEKPPARAVLEPSTISNNSDWQINCLVCSTESQPLDSCCEAVTTFIRQLQSTVVEAAVSSEDDRVAAQAAQSREQTASSALHQTELALRKRTSLAIARARANGSVAPATLSRILQLKQTYSERIRGCDNVEALLLSFEADVASLSQN